MIPLVLAQRQLDGELSWTTGAPRTTTAPSTSAAELCFQLCLKRGFCCNDYQLGSNQYISCAQACMMRHRGQKLEDLQQLCMERRSCVLNLDGFEYGFCSKCLDLTTSQSCKWGVWDEQACQVGAALQLCQPVLAGQIVTLYDTSKDGFLTVGEIFGSLAVTGKTQDESDVRAHWRMERSGTNSSEWSFQSVSGVDGADPETWLLAECAAYVSPTNRFPVYFNLEAISSGAFRVTQGAACTWNMIIEAYPPNLSSCVESAMAAKSQHLCASFWLVFLWLPSIGRH